MVDAVKEPLTGAEEIVWDLSTLYTGPDDPNITDNMEAVERMVDDFAARYKGRVGSLSASELNEAMQLLETIYDRNGRIGSYASLLYSTDTADPKHGALMQRITEFDSKIEQKLVFFDLEWNKADEDHVQTMLDDPTLEYYRHHLEATRRYKPHQLSEPEEQIIIEKDVTGNYSWARFFTQLTSAMRYEFEGQKLTQTEVLVKLYDPDREIRRKAADAMTAGLRERSMELTYIFNTLAADKSTTDRLRQYPNWISSRNLANKAPDAVVDALVKSVTSNYDLVARHYRLKRVILGLDELTDYDRYAPLPIQESDKLYTWEEAREIILNAFYAFSQQMGEVGQRFFDGQWIHAALAPNKRGGAFASPTVPSSHPFVFLNYTGKARDVATLAHELGHGIHMALSAEESGLFGLYTPLTTAEMASVFAEMLVFTDLIDKEPSAEARLAMLVAKVEDTFATVFRQTSMNRFEDLMHTARRGEGELPTERFSEMWLETQRAMFGDSVNLRDDYGMWWSYVPHFLHTPGYVYAYAFGELLVLALFNLYKERGESFVPQYLEVLAAGNSDYPDKILAKVGVDLNNPAFWNKGIDAIRELVEQEEALAREVYPEKFA